MDYRVFITHKIYIIYYRDAKLIKRYFITNKYEVKYC